MAWSGRDHTGRQLSDVERGFLAALSALLSEVAPNQIEEGETALAAERTICLIALMPHRALGGVAIVVWLFADRAEVTWAQVAGLAHTHDALDLGVSVARFSLDPARPVFGPLLECIRDQLEAPLTMRLYGPDHATVLVRDGTGVLRKVGQLGPRFGRLRRFRSRQASRDVIVRLIDQASPPLTEPSGVDGWFRP